MEKSLFQFSNPHIESIIFKINDTNKDVNDIPIEIDIQSFIQKEEASATVKLILTIGETTDNNTILTALYFKGCIVSDFNWKDDIPDLDKKLKVNGGTVLLSYIRPILATLTMQAGIQPLHLPFINFNN